MAEQRATRARSRSPCSRRASAARRPGTRRAPPASRSSPERRGSVLERRPAAARTAVAARATLRGSRLDARVGLESCGVGDGGTRQTFLKTPTTLPSTSASGCGSACSRLVLGLQADVVLLAEEALDGRLVLDQRDDDLAVVGVVGRLDDDEVALEDAGVPHRVAADPQDVVAALAADHGRAPRGTPRCSPRRGSARRRRPGRRAAARRAHDALGPVDQDLDRPRLGRVAAQHARALELGEVRVHGRRASAGRPPCRSRAPSAGSRACSSSG